MGIGKMTTFIDIIEVVKIKDSEGFSRKNDKILASVRAYKEDRHGSVAWRNRAAFSESSTLFRFRKIPKIGVTPGFVIVCGDGRYETSSIEDIKGKSMYVEVLAKKIEPI